MLFITDSWVVFSMWRKWGTSHDYTQSITYLNLGTLVLRHLIFHVVFSSAQFLCKTMIFWIFYLVAKESSETQCLFLVLVECSFQFILLSKQVRNSAWFKGRKNKSNLHECYMYIERRDILLDTFLTVKRQTFMLAKFLSHIWQQLFCFPSFSPASYFLYEFGNESMI